MMSARRPMASRARAVEGPTAAMRMRTGREVDAEDAWRAAGRRVRRWRW
jgi:hypothetical protein